MTVYANLRNIEIYAYGYVDGSYRFRIDLI